MGGAPGLITALEMRELLRAVYAGDNEGRLLTAIARELRDPARPLDEHGRSRLHPLWLALLVILLVAAASFALFTLLEQ